MTHQPVPSCRLHALLVVALSLLALAACQPAPQTVAAPTAVPATPQPTATEPPTGTPPPEPVTASVNLGAPPGSIDPVLVAPLDSAAGDLIANLFAGLARLDGDTGRVEPELALRWEQLDDGRTWYVYLRDDIPWVQANASGEVTAARPINAGDVVAAARRACHPQTGAPLGSTPALFLIEGCEAINQTDPATLTPEYVAQLLGVRALNDAAVEFRLTEDSALFPTLLATAPLTPIPAELVESAGEAWTQPGTVWTSGPFAVGPASPGGEVGYTLLANPHWPLPRGNVDAVEVTFGGGAEVLDAWSAGSLDLTVIPGSEVAGIDFENDPAYRQLALPAVEFLVAVYDRAPLSDASVRRALSQALDRQAIIDEVLEPQGQTAIPAHSITPPGMALAPPYGEVGLSYDSEAARESFAEAGFRDCDFMPPFALLTPESSSELSAELAARYVASWREVFGCGERISVEQRPLVEVLGLLEPVNDAYRLDRPGLIALGWQADYPDAHHWLTDIFACRELFPESVVNQGRACILPEERLLAAGAMHDDEARAAVYRDTAEAFFGPGGEMPVIPVLIYTRPLAVNPWLEAVPQQAGPLRFDQWNIDAAGQP